ncbi:MAG: cytochrome c5 family protein [Piscirickettsiaceae bacterium]|nr:cytochrome c5 family protein [Piscirickettsiaceae bacterium]
MEIRSSSKFFAGSIVAFLIIIISVYAILSTTQNFGKDIASPETISNNDIVERIKPEARINVSTISAPKNHQVVETSNVGGGKKIVTQICAMCHDQGVMNAPKLGNNKDWAPRIRKGIDVLYENALNGFNMMPARGGDSSLTDNNVKSAVNYMIYIAK